MEPELIEDLNLLKEKRVWLVQLYCGELRHCIICAAYEASLDDGPAHREALTDMNVSINRLLDQKMIDPFCGLCGGIFEKWFIESAPSVFKTMAEAIPELKKLEGHQAVSRDLMRKLGLSPRSDFQNNN